jgi:hypothetical protein
LLHVEVEIARGKSVTYTTLHLTEAIKCISFTSNFV